METMTSVQAIMKEKFYSIFLKQDFKLNSFVLTQEKYSSLIEDIKRIKMTKKKESTRDYRLMQRYDVFSIHGTDKLIKPLTQKNQDLKFYVPVEEIFDIMYNTHLSLNHGGRDRMKRELKTHYNNITQQQIQQFLDLCDSCEVKRRSEKNIIKPAINYSELNSQGQVNLIDYQSQPDGEYKFLLVYQDHKTKFIILKPLKSNQIQEVAYNILDIFLLFGPPKSLQFNYGHEFCDRLIENLTYMWPELKIDNGNPMQSQNQDIGRPTQDIKNMLKSWMKDNNSNKWNVGARFVQFMKNRSYHLGIRQTPYEAMFACSTKVDHSSSYTEDNQDLDYKHEVHNIREYQNTSENEAQHHDVLQDSDFEEDLIINDYQIISDNEAPSVNASEEEGRHSSQDIVVMNKKTSSESNPAVISKSTSIINSKSTFTKQNSHAHKRKLSTTSETFSNDEPFSKSNPDSQENQRTDYSNDEYEAFGKLIAIQLRQLPLYNAITCQEQIHLLVKRHRLLALKTQEKIQTNRKHEPLPPSSLLHSIKSEICSDIETLSD